MGNENNQPAEIDDAGTVDSAVVEENIVDPIVDDAGTVNSDGKKEPLKLFKDDDDPNGAPVDPDATPGAEETPSSTTDVDFNKMFDDPSGQEKLFEEIFNDTASKDAANAKAAIASATQKNMAVAEERRQLGEERTSLDAMMTKVDAMTARMEQAMSGMSLTGSPQQAYGNHEAGDFDFDPGQDVLDAQNIMNHPAMKQMNQKVQSLERVLGMMSMESKVSRIDTQLKTEYPDYDAKLVDSQIAKMDDSQLRAAVFKAHKLDSTDYDKQIADAEKRGADKVFKHFQNIRTKSKEIGDPLPPVDKGNGSPITKPTGKWDDALKNVKKYNLFNR